MNYEAFFQLSYGLYIVSSFKEGKMNGFIGNTAFQVTAEPPTLAISVNKNNYTHSFIEESGLFSVSVLEQKTAPEIIQTFGYKSGRDINKFTNVKWKTGDTGLPLVLTNTSALFECKVVETLSVGTHAIFVGKVLSTEIFDNMGEPLTYSYYRNVLKGKAPKNAPTYIDASKLKKTGGNMDDKKYTCQVCHYEYDPEKGDPDHGIAPGTSFADLPDDWVCPVCGVTKDNFK